MAHEIDTSNNRANIAYAGETPWHGLGEQIEAKASVSAWRKAAGLEFSIRKASIHGTTDDGKTIDGKSLNRSILYRDDTMAPLSVMSTDTYNIVQPEEILDFIASSAKSIGASMEVAGSLRGGRKVWALAKLPGAVGDVYGDKVNGYLLAATACDGSMASEFMFTSVRVVCQNTLHMATRGQGGGLKEDKNAKRVKVYHFQDLDVKAVKAQLGIAPTVWASFIENAKRAASIKVTPTKAVQILRTVYEKPDRDVIEGRAERISDEQFLKENTTARYVLELFQGGGIGMDLRSTRNTGWGLVNAATEYYDHASRTRSVDTRLDTAWFGNGAQRKQDVMDAVLAL